MAQILYKIELLNQPLEIEENSYKKSVKIIEFYSSKKIREIYLGYVTKEEVYDRIKKGDAICLDHCYVKDFSISEYRKINSLEDKATVEINNFSAKNAFFDCDAYTDFSHIQFSSSCEFTHSIFIHGSLNFTHAIFEKGADFSDCSFQSYQTLYQYCEVKGEKFKFENSRFNGEMVSFINTSLQSSEVNFKRVNFHTSKVKFHFATFGEGLKTFEKIKFHGPVFDFRRVNFGEGKIDFRRSLFGSGHVTFEESEIESGKFTFRLSKFEGGDLSFRRMNFGCDEVNLDHVSFGCKTISFENAIATNISISNSDIHSTLDLRIKSAHRIDLTESYLHSITDLNFHKADALSELVLIGTKNLGKIIIFWEKNQVRKLIMNQKVEPIDWAEQFNTIKDNFTKNGQYNDEDYAYVHYKRYELASRKQSAIQNAKLPKFMIHFSYSLKSLIFDKMGLFATSPNRVFLSMIVAIAGFASIYMLFEFLELGHLINSVDATDQLDVVDKSLYHSSITFFTIGYGDYYPTSWNRLVSAIEGWVGVFMMSYFTVAFVRKILR